MTNNLMDILTELKEWLEDECEKYCPMNYNPYERVLDKLEEIEDSHR